jgi:hypothetical protein
MASWVETASFIASSPVRVGVMIALAQSGQTLDEITLAQTAGLLHQHITGQPIETAIVISLISELSRHGAIARDDSGFRWQLTAIGTLVSRQWAIASLEPEGDAPLDHDEVRAWRDALIAQLEEDSDLAEEADISPEELLAGQTSRLSELRVLNRVIGDERLPEWISALAR